MRSDQENETREKALLSQYMDHGIAADRAATLATVVVVVEEVLQTTLNEHQQAYVLRAVDALQPAPAAPVAFGAPVMLTTPPTS